MLGWAPDSCLSDTADFKHPRGSPGRRPLRKGNKKRLWKMPSTKVLRDDSKWPPFGTLDQTKGYYKQCPRRPPKMHLEKQVLQQLLSRVQFRPTFSCLNCARGFKNMGLQGFCQECPQGHRMPPCRRPVGLQKQSNCFPERYPKHNDTHGKHAHTQMHPPSV